MIQLNYRDQRPIYEQVKDGLRHLVVTGAMEEGERLPSVRKLATTLAINPNTIQRAYDALEKEGYIYSIAGKGSFAAPQSDVGDGRREELLKQFDEAVTELLFLGVQSIDLIARMKGRDGEPVPYRENTMLEAGTEEGQHDSSQ